MTESTLPPIQRVVTGHDGQGRAIFKSDETFVTERIASGDADFALIWTTASVPADNNDETSGESECQRAQ